MSSRVALARRRSPRSWGSPGAPATPGTTRRPTSRTRRTPPPRSRPGSPPRTSRRSPSPRTPRRPPRRRTTGSMQELGDGDGPRRHRRASKQTGKTAVATLHWTWDLTAATWEYDAEASSKLADDELAGGLGAVGRRAVAGRGREPRTSRRCWPTVATSSARAGSRSSPSARSRASASTRPSSTEPTPPPPPAPSPSWSASTSGPYVKAVKAAGAQAFVEAIVFRQEELPAAVSSRDHRRSRAAGSSRPTCRSGRPATSRPRCSARSAR